VSPSALAVLRFTSSNLIGCSTGRSAAEFRHACKLSYEGIVSKRLGLPYRSGRSRDWIKSKNLAAPAVKREAEEDWGR